MSDSIDRQAAISLPVLPKKYREYQTMNLDDAYELGWYDLQKCIEKLPSAQPELIRCNSCRHDNNCEIQYAAQAGSKFFCGAAERREE